jgi:hypothetical protein
MKNAFALPFAVLFLVFSLPGKTVAQTNSLSTTTSAPTDAVTQTNLFPEGSCEILNSDGLPEGFIFPDKNDKPWLGGNTASVQQADGKHFVHFVNSEAFPYFNKIRIPLPVPDGAKKITVSGRFRADFKRANTDCPWYGYHVHLVFGSKPSEAGEFPDAAKLADQMIINIDQPTDWGQQEGSLPVPAGAKYMVVQIMLSGYVGKFDFGDIKVISQ